MRYAKKDIYAEVEEEGGRINRLVAVAGQPVSEVYLDVIDPGDLSDTPPEPGAAVEDTARRSSSARRAGQTVEQAEKARERSADAQDGEEKPSGARAKRSGAK